MSLRVLGPERLGVCRLSLRRRVRPLLRQRGHEAQMVESYASLLARARAKLPEVAVASERFEVPRAQLQRAGLRTIFVNFDAVAQKLRREPEHLLKYVLKQLATSRETRTEQVILIGNFSEDQVNRKIQQYVEAYVLCKECSRPDTKLVREDRLEFLKCEACGAKHPVAKV